MDLSEYTVEQLWGMSSDILRNKAKALREIQKNKDWLHVLHQELIDIRNELERRHADDKQRLAEWNALTGSGSNEPG